jgi:hypothetical protein
MPKAKVKIADGKVKPVYYSKRLTCPGLKPSDYYLFRSIRDYFNYDMRELVVLGLRYLYSNAHDPVQREKILYLANEVHAENLDVEDSADRPDYHSFPALMQEQASL